MSDADANSGNVPILTRASFPKWENQVISFLTGTADHVRVIERRPGAGNALVDPARPADDPNYATVAAAQAKWDASGREALGVIMCTAVRPPPRGDPPPPQDRPDKHTEKNLSAFEFSISLDTTFQEFLEAIAQAMRRKVSSIALDVPEVKLSARGAK